MTDDRLANLLDIPDDLGLEEKVRRLIDLVVRLFNERELLQRDNRLLKLRIKRLQRDLERRATE